MPVRIQNITDEAHQTHTILFEESEIELTVRFLPVVGFWFIDVSYGGRAAYGCKLSVGVLHLLSRNYPFDFTVRDLTSQGLDPVRRDDFITGRCALYMLDAEDMETIRDEPVPL